MGNAFSRETPPAILLTEELKAKLSIADERIRQSDDGQKTPVAVKVFQPDGGSTYLLTSLDVDEQSGEAVLWAVFDAGFGTVEYGTVLLSELEEARGNQGLPMEVDEEFNTEGLFVEDLLQLESLSPESIERSRIVMRGAITR